MRVLAALAATTLLVLAGCHDKTKRKLTAPGGPITVKDELSDLSFTLTPERGGYAIATTDGTALGTVRIGETVVVRNAEGKAVAKVHQKPGGYELTDGDGIPAVAGRVTDHDHVRMVTPTGAELLVASGTTLKVRGEAVQATRQGGHIAVGRKGRRIVKVEGELDARAAAFLGVTELDVYRRIALLVWTDRWR